MASDLERIEEKHKGCAGCLNVGPCVTVKLARALDEAILLHGDHCAMGCDCDEKLKRTLHEVAGGDDGE